MKNCSDGETSLARIKFREMKQNCKINLAEKWGTRESLQLRLHLIGERKKHKIKKKQREKERFVL